MAEDNLENWNTYRQGKKAFRINKWSLYIYLYPYVISQEKGLCSKVNPMLITVVKVYSKGLYPAL